MTFDVIPRESVDYHSLEAQNNIASATAIRNWLENHQLESVMQTVPSSTYNLIPTRSQLTFLDDFFNLLKYALLEHTPESLREIHEMTEGLENRFLQNIRTSQNMAEFLTAVKTKRYTMTRIKRLVIYTLLNIRTQSIKDFNLLKPHYVRVLAADAKGLELLKKMKSECSLPIITNLSQFTSDVLPLMHQLKLDIKASDLRSIAIGSIFGTDYLTTPYIKK
jgi:predicted nucleotidyltransferase